MDSPQTQREVGAHLPNVLAALAVQYVCKSNVAWHGSYERCSKDGNLDWCLLNAIIGGHLRIVQLMISRGATVTTWAIQQVCNHGHVALAQFLLATQRMNAVGWAVGFLDACESGHIDIVRLLLPKLKPREGFARWGLNNACARGHLPIVDLMIAHGAIDWNTGLTIACEYRQAAIVRRMLEMGATQCGNCDKNH